MMMVAKQEVVCCWLTGTYLHIKLVSSLCEFPDKTTIPTLVECVIAGAGHQVQEHAIVNELLLFPNSVSC